MNKNLRRRLLFQNVSLPEKTFVYEKGSSKLSKGKFGYTSGDVKISSSWLGGYTFTVRSEEASEGYYYGAMAEITGVDFTEFTTLHIDGSVTEYLSFADIAVGYGYNSGTYEWQKDSSTWKAREKLSKNGAFSVDISISRVNGQTPILIMAYGGSSNGDYAAIQINNIWLE